MATDGGAHRKAASGTYGSVTLIAPERDLLADPLNSAHPVKKVHDLGMGGGPLDDQERVTLLVCLCSGWVMFLEGINGMSGLAVSYYFKETLKLSPATITSVSSITALPWTCKPIYGFVSDAFPLFGYRRKPYMFLAGFFGSVSWMLLSTPYVDTAFAATACMTLGSGAIAVANVIAEAMVVEQSRGESQAYASRLQSIIYAGQAVGGIIAAWCGGAILTVMSDKQVFLLVATFPLSLFVVAWVVPEQRHYGDALGERSAIPQRLRELWGALRQPAIWRPCAFIFLLNATPATGAAWFFFYTDVLKFSSTFLGTVGLVGSVCTLAGVYVFDATLKSVSFRTVFLWSTIVSTVLGLTQLLVVFRWNLALGIPDAVFCLGESAILSIVGWICTMPVLVLAARLCPEGMEGTLYATIMSINNFGGIIGSQIGAVITAWLGVTEGHLENFWLLVLICNLSSLLPLVFIGCIPDEDPLAEVNRGQAEHGGYSKVDDDAQKALAGRV